jgi:hypothetical protein
LFVEIMGFLLGRGFPMRLPQPAVGGMLPNVAGIAANLVIFAYLAPRGHHLVGRLVPVLALESDPLAKAVPV